MIDRVKLAVVMPDCCAVFGCKSNYPSDIKINGVQRVFKLPNEPELRHKWIKRLHRKEFTPTKRTKVCIKHFVLSDFFTHSTAKKGKHKKQQQRRTGDEKLARAKLKPDALPKTHENLPVHLNEDVERPERTSSASSVEVVL